VSLQKGQKRSLILTSLSKKVSCFRVGVEAFVQNADLCFIAEVLSKSTQDYKSPSETLCKHSEKFGADR
jgi:hypothetical protein